MNPQTQDTALLIRDVILPDSILWWPLAPGWWIMLSLFVICVLGLFLYKKTNLKRKMITSIHSELKYYYQEFQKKSDSQIFIQQLSALLRRVSLYRYQDLPIAKLQGTEWLEFLDSTLPEQQQDGKTSSLFKSGVGQVFLLGPYQKEIQDDLYPVYDLVEYWIDHNLKLKYGLL